MDVEFVLVCYLSFPFLDLLLHHVGQDSLYLKSPLLRRGSGNRNVRPWELEPVVERSVHVWHRHYAVSGSSLVDLELHPCDQYRYLPDQRWCFHGGTVLIKSLEFYGQQQWCVLVVLVFVDARRGVDFLYQGHTVGLVYLEFHLGEVAQAPLDVGTGGGYHVDVLYEQIV